MGEVLWDRLKTSRSFRLEIQPLIQKYGFTGRLVLEETDQGILIRKVEKDKQLSWEYMFKAMAIKKEETTTVRPLYSSVLLGPVVILFGGTSIPLLTCSQFGTRLPELRIARCCGLLRS